MFSTICEIILGTFLRARLVSNDRNKLYLDLRTLNERGFNTTSGLFLPSEDLQQFFDMLFAQSTPDVYTEHMLGSKLVLKKTDSDSVSILVAKRASTMDLSGVRMDNREYENLRNQAEYFLNTIQSHRFQKPANTHSNNEAPAQSTSGYKPMPKYTKNK